MLNLLYDKKRELENELIKLDEAVEKTEAKLDLITEIIKEEEAKAPAEASCEANHIAAEVKEEAVEQEKETIYIKYSNEL